VHDSANPISAAAPQVGPTLDPLATIDLKALHSGATFLRILGVNYIHINTDDGGDMYLTSHGVPFIKHLAPENWFERKWFREHRQPLLGTGTVYRLPTRPIANGCCKSIELVVKWSRVGQDVTLDTLTLQRNVNAEFNTPFEEFARVEELRRGDQGPARIKLLTQKPLAIYVPPEQMQPWQTGRSTQRILARTARHPGVEIDVLRAYIMLYGWIDGINAVDALKYAYCDINEHHRQLEELTLRVDRELAAKGFQVVDHKPTHFILRMKNETLVRKRDGELLYALVDYELLARTEDYEDWLQTEKRKEYLQRQKLRFNQRPETAYPAPTKPAEVFDVPYVYGRAESTGGRLWVVGRDPDLFPYFLPERWRNSQQVRLSHHPPTYYAQTKDRIHLVWKISHVGERPPGNLADATYKRLSTQGYNSPFEEFSIALRLQRKGVKTTYPRAIYRTGSPGDVSGHVMDDRRFEMMKPLLAPGGEPVMPLGHDYITIWGYWRGLEDDAAPEDVRLWTPIDVANALNKNLIDEPASQRIMQCHAEVLAKAGFEDLNYKMDHVLISYIPSGSIKTTPDGQIEARQCNFEMMREL
jgi:hypothetical protein